MDVRQVDLNLLVFFEAMLRHRSVTAAGRELGMSQPSASYALLRMRNAFEDPLFIRVSSGMEPTPRAIAMQDTVRDVLMRIRTDLLSPASFDPQASSREFRIATSDVGESFFVPRIDGVLRSQGRRLRLRVVSSTPAELEQQLASGEIDLAMGHYPDLVGADFFQQALFTSHFVVIAKPGNPHVGDELTMERFLAAPHIDVSTPGRSQEIILRHMAEQKIVRHVPLRVSRFLSLLEIVSQSDLIAVVPREVAQFFRSSRDIEVHPLPFESPHFRLRQHWHKRFHGDGAVGWLREQMHALFKDTPAT
ncbi:LysR family transcriptional regulator [Aquabacterium sp. J223]|uniref:LysR family transcriptional regulator n=1 Tax=Aquabacterium sp. J223 TaxID=2898431 RepID=UPI0021ADC958|nr:LysR family transcriptional regulator [Aquabacterium sp. J223]UUX95223.1 LysR family transcriptional regulator [Aquabacterium sp. J223]